MIPNNAALILGLNRNVVVVLATIPMVFAAVGIQRRELMVVRREAKFREEWCSAVDDAKGAPEGIA